jgi:RNA polymerase sigma factor (TIGR02999 family)
LRDSSATFLSNTPVHEVTRILSVVEQDPRAAEQLLPLVYDELRRLAVDRMAREKPGQTIQATALVHEAYLRLVDVKEAQHWNSRGHFFVAAAEAMRRILVENARRKKTEKHGGQYRRVALEDLPHCEDFELGELLTLDETLQELGKADAKAAELVKLHCFAGLSIEEAACVLNISPRTAYRDWAYARAWLFKRMEQLSRDAAD